MSQGNALDRLMKKQKPTVPARTDVVNESVSLDIKTQRQLDVNNLKKKEDEQLESEIDDLPSTRHDSKTNLSQDYLTPEDFETVRNTLRIESTVDLELRRLCSEERITKETWLEAAYLYLSDQPDALAEVVQLAQERLQHRKAIADYKRAKTMQQRFLNL